MKLFFAVISTGLVSVFGTFQGVCYEDNVALSGLFSSDYYPFYYDDQIGGYGDSVDLCATVCKDRSFYAMNDDTYISDDYNQFVGCICLDSLSDELVRADGKCTDKCVGNDQLFCGGTEQHGNTEKHFYTIFGDFEEEEEGDTCDHDDFLNDLVTTIRGVKKLVQETGNRRLRKRTRRFFQRIREFEFADMNLKDLNSLKTQKNKKRSKCTLSAAGNIPKGNLEINVDEGQAVDDMCDVKSRTLGPDDSPHDTKTALKIFLHICFDYFEWGVDQCETKQLTKMNKRFLWMERLLYTQKRTDRFWLATQRKYERK